MGSSSNLEERLEAIESNLRDLNGRHDETRRLLDKEVHDRETALESERRARTDAENEIKTKLELSDTGGLDLSLTGVFWLALGLLLSTASTEVAHFLAG